MEAQDYEVCMSDVTGLRKGRLVVIGRLRAAPSMVRVQCDCGTVKILPLSSVKHGTTQSCGCWKRDRIRLIHDVIDTRPEFVTDRRFLEENPVFRIDRGGDGIMPIKSTGKWRAFITVAGKKITIGKFDTEADARVARSRALNDMISVEEKGVRV